MLKISHHEESAIFQSAAGVFNEEEAVFLELLFMNQI